MTRRHPFPRITLDLILPHLRIHRQWQRHGERHVWAFCPAHDDRNTPNLRLTEKTDGTLLWHCFRGCSQEAVREALERLVGVQPATARPIAPRNRRTQRRGTPPYPPVSLAQLADAKGLDTEKLRAWHVREIPAGHAPEAPDGGLEIPYLTREGERHTIQSGAGSGNRTRTASLEGWSSTIELCPLCTTTDCIPASSIPLHIAPKASHTPRTCVEAGAAKPLACFSQGYRQTRLFGLISGGHSAGITRRTRYTYPASAATTAEATPARCPKRGRHSHDTTPHTGFLPPKP